MENLVLFGAGRETERFISSWEDIIKIEYILDNAAIEGQERRLGKYQVYPPTKDKIEGTTIVITPAYYYQQIKNQLEVFGLAEGKDFLGVEEYISSLEEKGTIAKRQEKRITFSCFAKNFDIYNNEFVNTLSSKYKLIYDDVNPEYVFCSVWETPYEYLKYDGIRIFYSGENIGPDFNFVDYAIAYNRDLHYEDRFFRELPFYGRKVGGLEVKDISEKTKFCNFIYSHERDDDKRRIFFEKLNKYKKVDAIGTYLNNMPGGFCVTRLNKIANTRPYKFSIAFESVNMSGFITEKISDAFDARTIPIYLGDPHVSEIFNKDAYIDVNDYDNLDEVVEKIIELDNEDKAYLEMVNQPIFNPDFDNVGKLKEMQNFLLNIFEQPYEKAFRRGFGPSKHLKGVLIQNKEYLMRG